MPPEQRQRKRGRGPARHWYVGRPVIGLNRELGAGLKLVISRWQALCEENDLEFTEPSGGIALRQLSLRNYGADSLQVAQDALAGEDQEGVVQTFKRGVVKHSVMPLGSSAATRMRDVRFFRLSVMLQSDPKDRPLEDLLNLESERLRQPHPVAEQRSTSRLEIAVGRVAVPHADIERMLTYRELAQAFQGGPIEVTLGSLRPLRER